VEQALSICEKKIKLITKLANYDSAIAITINCKRSTKTCRVNQWDFF